MVSTTRLYAKRTIPRYKFLSRCFAIRDFDSLVDWGVWTDKRTSERRERMSFLIHSNSCAKILLAHSAPWSIILNTLWTILYSRLEIVPTLWRYSVEVRTSRYSVLLIRRYYEQTECLRIEQTTISKCRHVLRNLPSAYLANPETDKACTFSSMSSASTGWMKRAVTHSNSISGLL